MRLVILESPFAGATPKEAVENKRYARRAMLDSLNRGESPLASHLLWPGILDDAIPGERERGIEAGLAWGRVAEATVVYTDLGVSRGMVTGIMRAHQEGRIVERRQIGAPQYQEQDCPGHTASQHDPKVCGRCGIHIDSLRP